MGWPVTELYRDVKSPWARQRNPIWRPLLGGDNSAPAGSSGSRASCHALSAQSCSPALPSLRPAGYSYVVNTHFEPPQPKFMSTESSVLYVFIKRANRGFLQDKRETTSVTEICVRHNHSFWGFSINYKQHFNI